LATIGESHGTGVGTGALGGAAGLAAGGVAGTGAAAFGGAVAGAEPSAGVLTSACTEPDAVAFTTPGTAGLSGNGFTSPSGDGEEGDLGSSGIAASAQTSGAEACDENVNFYQLEDALSTSLVKIRIYLYSL